MMELRETTKVSFDGYFMLEVKWKGGFTHKVPCRGYNLGSQIRFTESLFWVESYDYTKCTKEEYEAYVFGDGSDFEETTNGRASKTKAQQKNPTKAKPRAKRSEDSKSTRDSSGKSPRAVKEKSSGVRKPKLPNVSKPKKSVQGTDDSGKKTLPGSGRTKRQTQQRTTK